MLYYARISDNVLGDADYPLRVLEVVDDVVVSAVDVRQGVYDFSGGPDVGWTRAQLDAWVAHDPTGNHPEVYHDLQTTPFK